MITLDEDALICDLAETYHIFDYKALPPSKVAVLAVGLRDNSRIKMRLSEMKVNLDTMLMAMIIDRLALISWQLNGDDGVEKPESVLRILSGEEKQNNNMAFESGADFEQFRSLLIGNKHE